jgi:hypothetical protein
LRDIQPGRRFHLLAGQDLHPCDRPPGNRLPTFGEGFSGSPDLLRVLEFLEELQILEREQGSAATRPDVPLILPTTPIV